MTGANASSERSTESHVELSKVFGGNVGGVIPDPIPNSEVKPSRADGTARVTAWESRSPPGLLAAPQIVRSAGFLYGLRPTRAGSSVRAPHNKRSPPRWVVRP